MSFVSALRKTKLTVTISGDIVSEIDDIAKKKRAPRSQIMEKMLRDWLLITHLRQSPTHVVLQKNESGLSINIYGKV